MLPTRRQKKRIPKAKDIVLMMRALSACIPMHARPNHGLRESLKGVVNYRFNALPMMWIGRLMYIMEIFLL